MWLSHQQAAVAAVAALARAGALTQRLSPKAVGTVGTWGRGAIAPTPI